MSLRGEQWICPCGFHNLTLRGKCRNCGGFKSEAIGGEDVFEVMDKVSSMSLEELQEEEKRTEEILKKSQKVH